MDGDSQTPTLPDTQLQKHVELFLLKLQDSDRGPKGLADSWREAQHVADKSVPGVLLKEGGFPVWYGYLLAKGDVEKSSRFAGKAATRDLIADLENRPVEYLKSLATTVTCKINPVVAAKVEQVRRTRIECQTKSMSQKSNKRPRTADNNDDRIGRPITPSPTFLPGDPAFHLTNLDCSPQELDLHPDDPLNYLAESKHVLVNASLKGATRLFPTSLSDSIKRIPNPINENGLVAGISMTFPRAPYTDKFGCQMAIEILENKVEWIAQKLFDVRLETTEGLRYVLLPGGTKVLPHPSITLQGGCFEVVPHIFGSETDRAITASPAHQDDVKQAMKRTSSVSMVVSHQARNGAVIYVSLGLLEGTQIKDKLFL
ncbi:uncharacterized protein VDAG_04927 [Verticillium dahliae VdLs.17]|uniref:Uncharacterized protein n=1 Tax=Verticillium dahliae (strain VdLs.17 / ATCC MYA-4575 / FGSC 10137) TaxID=498257 RepID=G2X3E2_VERDV|nr:uncharacterized protein VDAG_04927 [Verticillium dahliae VdLs.17]EGY23489.1 hypothetical protein VDAG_04927 [Verticillium dahliae VdLs.17]KAH6708488.1 hypothetical protein EV126DRAFT_332077 [Verticillium dahliae]